MTNLLLFLSIGMAAPALAVGIIGAAAVHGMSRNPEASRNIQTQAILSTAFAEAIGVYVLVLALILKFV